MHARIAVIRDPRVHRQRRHVFSEVIVLTTVAFLANSNDGMAVERFGRARREWWRTFLRSENGIPSHETIGRIFAMRAPDEFAAIWEPWMREICARLGLKHVAVDGKTMRGSGSDSRRALHAVTAFAAENGLSPAREVVAEKSSEIPAIPERLKRPDISRAIVTINAMGCRTEIASQIRSQGADYLSGVKGNRPTLLRRLRPIRGPRANASK